jgi:hypothetical protein
VMAGVVDETVRCLHQKRREAIVSAALGAEAGVAAVTLPLSCGAFPRCTARQMSMINRAGIIEAVLLTRTASMTSAVVILMMQNHQLTCESQQPQQSRQFSQPMAALLKATATLIPGHRSAQ